MRAALLALLLASSAWAAPTAHYVSVSGSQAGSTAWTNSTNPLDPCALSVANGFATSGDSVIVADGIYSNAIAPSATGVIFVGNTTDPASVSVSGITPKNDAKVCGVMSRSGVTFPRLARRVVLEDFAIVGGLAMQDAERCRVSRGTLSGQVSINRLTLNSTHAQLDTLEDLTVTTSVNGTWALVMGTAYNADHWEIARVEQCLFRRVRFVTTSSGSSAFGPVKMFRSSSNRFEDCRLSHTTTATAKGSNEPERTWVVRDSSAGNTWLRDTVDVNSTGAAFDVYGFCLVSGTGASPIDPVGLNQTCVNNTWDACVVKVSKSAGALLWQDTNNGTRFQNTILASREGPAINYTATGVVANPTMRHCTLYSGNGAALRVVDLVNNATSPDWSGNLFYSRTGSVCVAHIKSSTDRFANDSSLIYHGTGTSSQAKGEGTCSTAGSFATWGNPAFLDTAWATLTLRPGPGSAAVSAAFPGGYAGHYDPNTIVPPADTEAPARVDDLSGAAVGTTSAALTWTASGDDNRAGTATTTYVKQHTAAINTESDWTAATTIATISGGSNSTGGEQQSYAATGLSAATTYWFCVRSLDEVPNAGSVGNTISVTTSATPDTMPPSPISNLTATALTSTSVLLSWTAPGGDRSTGQASTYVIRYRAGTTLTEAQWAAATNIAVNPTPSPAGALEEWTVGGLSASTTYTFAIKASDAVPNQSVISNPATVVTQGVPAAPPGPLTYGNNRRRRR